jgi:hypothetical protein
MATSGSVNFAMNRDEIIQDAMETIREYQADAAISSYDLGKAARKLNMMVKAWMAQGTHLWALKEATLFLSPGTKSYSLGATGTHCTHTYVHTTLSTDEALGSTSLGITSATGMSASDNIGIVLDDGTIHWTTISGAPGTTTTIATGLASAATAGNVVFAYTAKINRPQRIISAYRRDINDADIPLDVGSRKAYSDLTNKTTEGKPVQVFYDPQLTNGVLYIWPTADLATDVIRFWYERVLEDFDAVTDNPDFPIEWAEALSYNLADRLAPSFGMPLAERGYLKNEAREKLDIALGFDREESVISFQPDVR